MQQDDWSPSTGFKVGDRIAHTFQRSWMDIWWERIITLRWDVSLTERRTFLCTSVSSGSLWPEVAGLTRECSMADKLIERPNMTATEIINAKQPAMPVHGIIVDMVDREIVVLSGLVIPHRKADSG